MNHLLPNKTIFNLLVIIFAFALQIQISLFSGTNYLGLRINLADFILPFALIFAAISLYKNKTQLPQWHMPKFFIWICGLAIIMTAALIQGYFSIGGISMWAFANKYIGFFILCAYALLGGWIATNHDTSSNETGKTFGTWLSAFFITTLTYSGLCIFLLGFFGLRFWIEEFSWDGFMANRNAWAVLGIFVMIFLLNSRKTYDYSSSAILHHLFWLMLPLYCLYNASRSGWIIMLVAFLIFIARSPVQKLKVILPLLLIGVTLAYISFHTNATPLVEKTRQFELFLTGSRIPGTDQFYSGDMQRLIAYEDTFELFKNSNFILGGGLGSYKAFQIEKRGEFVNVVDCTPLWLLGETGLLGLVAFIGFFATVFITLYKNRGDHILRHTMIWFLLAFAGMSLLHELMYSRFVWFALGLALAKNKAEKSIS